MTMVGESDLLDESGSENKGAMRGKSEKEKGSADG